MAGGMVGGEIICSAGVERTAFPKERSRLPTTECDETTQMNALSDSFKIKQHRHQRMRDYSEMVSFTIEER